MKMSLILVLLMASAPLSAADPKYTEQRIHFYSGPGLKLTGVLIVPKQCSESRKCPGIVMAHGPGGYKSAEDKAKAAVDTSPPRKDFLTAGISEKLVASGFVFLGFSYRGVGDSEGPPYRLIPLEQVEDTQNAITFLQQQAAVDPERIGLIGLATGGAHASYLAGIDDRIKCMVSVNGMGDLGRWMREIRRYWEWVEFLAMLDEDRANRVLTGESRLLEQREIIVNDPASTAYRERMYEKYPEARKLKSYLSLESAEAIAQYRPEAMVHGISPRAAMWIAAENDTLLPPEHSIRMYENAGDPRKLVIIKGEEHHGLYHDEGFAEMVRNADAWFVEHLLKD